MSLRVLVCGGRAYTDAEYEAHILGRIHKEHHIDVIIEGSAPGADRFARNWAHDNGIEVLTYPADWIKYGRAAGPKRNTKMLQEGKPDLVVAFPGGRGTENMIAQAKRAGIRVIVIYP